jgi:DNA-directed RNA polymerase specialized sigma24 family protein
VISAAVVDESNAGGYGAKQAWLYATILTVGYIRSANVTASRNERLAVHLRFREDMTQTEMGRHIGCSQMHVSRILRSALARLENEAAAPLRGG